MTWTPATDNVGVVEYHLILTTDFDYVRVLAKSGEPTVTATISGGYPMLRVIAYDASWNGTSGPSSPFGGWREAPSSAPPARSADAGVLRVPRIPSVQVRRHGPAATEGWFDPRASPDPRTGKPRYDPFRPGQGWAVERAARHFDALTGHGWCLDAGGDVLVHASHDQPGWRIGQVGCRDGTGPATAGGLAVRPAGPSMCS